MENKIGVFFFQYLVRGSPILSLTCQEEKLTNKANSISYCTEKFKDNGVFMHKMRLNKYFIYYKKEWAIGENLHKVDEIEKLQVADCLSLV